MNFWDSIEKLKELDDYGFINVTYSIHSYKEFEISADFEDELKNSTSYIVSVETADRTILGIGNTKKKALEDAHKKILEVIK